MIRPGILMDQKTGPVAFGERYKIWDMRFQMTDF